MSNESKFWLGINVAILTAVVLVSYMVMSYWKDHNKLVADMVRQGVNPVAVMCAMQDSYGNNPTCIVLASKSASEGGE